jgi:hypothetical protein
MFRSPKWLLGSGLGILLATGTSSATILGRMDLPDLFKASDLVFTGVLSTTSVDLDSTGLPWTLYTFEDIEVVAGEYSGSEFSLRCPGGLLDGLITKVHATPDFQVGERSLVFFEEANWCQVAGWFQGEFKVVAATDGSGDFQVVNPAGRPAVSLGSNGFVWGEDQVWAPQATEMGVPRSLMQAAVNLKSNPPPVAPWRVLKDELTAFAQANPKMRPVKVVSQTTIVGAPLNGNSDYPVGR